MDSPRRRRRAGRSVSLQLEALEIRSLLSVAASAVFPRPEGSPVTDRLFVKFDGTAAAPQVNTLLAATGTQVLATYPSGLRLVETGLGGNAAQALAIFQASPLVVFAEADETIQVSTSSLPVVSPSYPSDSTFGQQWGLNSPNDVDIDAPEAWTATAGGSSTLVAVLDTGIDVNNPEFAGRIWVNPAASRGRSLVYGWNFIVNNGNVQDNNGHGTHVSGIIAAAANNGNGVVGVNFQARIMPLKVLGADGSGSLDSAVSAIYFAVANGARVINASWGSSTPNQALADAISYAGTRGVVFVTAAGNDSSNNDAVPNYPAYYHTSNMLVVAAVDQNGNLASFSNYGGQRVDLGAPGVNILSTYPVSKGGYAWMNGTSMATPYVTGVVSLLVGLHPDWSAQQLVGQVLATVKPLASLQGTTVSGGMVDAAQAVGVAGSGLTGNHYTGPPAVAASPTPPISPRLLRLMRQRQLRRIQGREALAASLTPASSQQAFTARMTAYQAIASARPRMASLLAAGTLLRRES